MKKNKKGFISSSVVYSFFIVTILLMTATLMTYSVKQKNSLKISEEILKENYSCEIVEGVYYKKDGNEAENETEFCKSCPEHSTCQKPCSVSCNKFKNSLGQEVSFDEWKESCGNSGYKFNPETKEIELDNINQTQAQWFDADGNPLSSEAEFKEKCGSEEEKYYCKIVEGIYYKSDGEPATDEDEFCKSCPTNEICENHCKIVDCVYYKKNGDVAETLDEYCISCPNDSNCTNPICVIKDGKYYGSDGKPVQTENEFYESCPDSCPKPPNKCTNPCSVATTIQVQKNSLGVEVPTTIYEYFDINCNSKSEKEFCESCPDNPYCSKPTKKCGGENGTDSSGNTTYLLYGETVLETAYVNAKCMTKTCETSNINGKTIYYGKYGDVYYDYKDYEKECPTPDSNGTLCDSNDTLYDCMLKNYASNPNHNNNSNISLTNITQIANQVKTISGTNLTYNKYTEYELYKDSSTSTFIFRNQVNYNWVKFAGLNWRVVSFDKNNVKLILDDESATDTSAFNSTVNKRDFIKYKERLMGLKYNGDTCIIETVWDGPVRNHKEYYGTYGQKTTEDIYNQQCTIDNSILAKMDVADLTYNNLYANNTNSTVLDYLEYFYEKYLLENDELINKDAEYCADKNKSADPDVSKYCSLIYGGTGFLDKSNNYICTNGLNITSWALNNVYYYDGLSRMTNNNASLTCGESGTSALIKNAFKNLNKYKAAATDGKGRGYLKYSIGLLTADEAVYAGMNLYFSENSEIEINENNNNLKNVVKSTDYETSSYLRKNYSYWLATAAMLDKNFTKNKYIYTTITLKGSEEKPDSDNNKGSYYFVVDGNKNGLKIAEGNAYMSVRPVITLKGTDLKICKEESINNGEGKIYTLSGSTDCAS